MSLKRRVAIAAVRLLPAEQLAFKIGQPFVHSLLKAHFDRNVAVSQIRIMQGNRAAHAFHIVSAAATGAGVDPKAGISL